MSKEMRRLMESVSDLTSGDLKQLTHHQLKKLSTNDNVDDHWYTLERISLSDWKNWLKKLHDTVVIAIHSDLSYEAAEMYGAITTSASAYTRKNKYGRPDGDEIGTWELTNSKWDPTGEYIDNSKSLGNGYIYHNDVAMLRVNDDYDLDILDESDLTQRDLVDLDNKVLSHRTIPIVDYKGREFGTFVYKRIHSLENELIRYTFNGNVEIDVTDRHEPAHDRLVNVEFSGQAGLVKDGDEEFFDIDFDTVPYIGYDKIEEIEFNDNSAGLTSFEIFTKVLPQHIGDIIESAILDSPDTFSTSDDGREFDTREERDNW